MLHLDHFQVPALPSFNSTIGLNLIFYYPLAKNTITQIHPAYKISCIDCL